MRLHLPIASIVDSAVIRVMFGSNVLSAKLPIQNVNPFTQTLIDDSVASCILFNERISLFDPIRLLFEFSFCAANNFKRNQLTDNQKNNLDLFHY